MSTILIRRLFVRKEFLTSTSPISRIGQYLTKNYAQPKLLLNMNEAFVKYNDGGEEFDISFRYINPELKLDRQFNFCRRADETVNTFLRRIDVNINKYVLKKMKRKRKKQDLDEETIIEDNVQNNKIRMIKDNTIIDGDLPCKSVLEDMSDLRLIIFDTEYKVKRNVPCITGIALPSSILVGFPTYPSKFESTHTDQKQSDFTWYKKEMFSSAPSIWTQVGKGYLYIPDISEIGYKLKLTCLPRNETQTGPMIEVESNNMVEAGPGQCPFDTRHAFTRNKLSGKRVVSYNILADVYAETDYSKDVLYPYCPLYALTMDYRKLLILKELIGFNADIICLQEVDSRVYENDLIPSLCTLNYDGVHNTKNELREGLAIFFNRERFEQLSSHHSVIAHGTNLDGFQTVWSQIQNENVKKRFLNRSTVIQTTTLRSKENSSEILIVGNTHLYFRPDADHIRLLQGYYAITYMRKLAKETSEKNPNCNVSILLCGDFNSVPECGIYQLMTQSYVPEDFADWKSNSEETVENVSLKHDLRLSSACGTPEYTNYTPGFAGCLDYIFYQTDRLEVEQVVPMPSKEEIILNTGLPSIVFPSDHISLCADLKWSK